MKVEVFEHRGEGINCVYKNNEWLVSIKNWKPDNDISGVHHLEVHHETDEQFILMMGQAILISADREGDQFVNIALTKMEIGKVYNVPKEKWFYSITQKDTKMAYVQHAATSMDNSDFHNLTPGQVIEIQKAAEGLLRQ